MDELPSSPRAPVNKGLIDDDAVRALRHVLLKTRAPVKGLADDYERAYAFWHTMWQSTFREVNADVELHSDVFLMHDEASVVLLGDQPVGLMLYDYRDLRVAAHRDISFFTHYPPDTLEALQAQGVCQVMLAGQLTVHPDWRRRRVGPFMSEALVSLALRRFLSSKADAMIAFTRNDRNTQELAYRRGARPLRQNHSAYGIASDVVAFYPEHVRESPQPQIADAVRRLWQQTRVPKVSPSVPSTLKQRRADNTQHVADGKVAT
jgi:GNAT superfamily N-acetyltransferase